MTGRRIIHILISFLCLCALSMNASETISRLVEQNDTNISLNNPIMSDSPIKVFLNDNVTEGIWKLEILNKNGHYENADCLQSYSGHCLVIPCGQNWSDAYRYYDNEQNRDFFIFRLSFYCNDNKVDEVEFKWGLLPSRPVISDIHFEYEYDWEWDMIYPNGRFSFYVESIDADKYWVYGSPSFLTEPPSFFTWCFYAIANKNTKIEYDADWGEYITLEAFNTYGCVLSDTICTTDYIYDKEILDRINDLSKVEEIDCNNGDVISTFENDEIHFDQTVEASVYDITGKIVIENPNADILYLSNLHKGVYFLIYRKDSVIHKYKFLKK